MVFLSEQEEAQQKVLADLERDELTTMHKNICSVLDTKAIPPGEDYVAETRRRVEGVFFFFPSPKIMCSAGSWYVLNVWLAPHLASLLISDHKGTESGLQNKCIEFLWPNSFCT